MKNIVKDGHYEDEIELYENEKLLLKCLIKYENIGKGSQSINCDIFFKIKDQEEMNKVFDRIEVLIMGMVSNKLYSMKCLKAGIKVFVTLFDHANGLIGDSKTNPKPIPIIPIQIQHNDIISEK